MNADRGVRSARDSRSRRGVLSLAVLVILSATPASAGGVPATPAATTADTITTLTYVSGSSVKLEQVLGDHDWADTTRATRSLTVTRADDLGSDIGMSFPSGDSLLFLFGDTIGASSQYVPTWASVLDPFEWRARDPLASSRTALPDSGLRLDFYTNSGDTTVTVSPLYPDGTPLAMGIDDTPECGIDLDSQLYIICHTGTVLVNGNPDDSNDSSVVVQFDPVAQTFTAGRTVSRLGSGGHFIHPALHELPMQFASSPSDSEVMIFGLGSYRHSDIYLSKIRKAFFASGINLKGNPATRYFTGLSGGSPTWSDSETNVVPIVQDNPLAEIGVGEVQQPWPNDDPTIGNFSVGWCPALQLWLMTFDGGRQSGSTRQTSGVYFTYAKAPWGPWMEPQLVFNATRDGAAGSWIRLYDRSTGTGTGPVGPTIGSQTSNSPDSTSGGIYAPGLIEPFTQVAGDTLRIFYTVSTWNPYTVVRMRSEFLVAPNQVLAAGGPPSPPVAAPLAVWPNPFRDATRVRFRSERSGAVEVAVFDLEGRLVRTLARESRAAGEQVLAWDGRQDDGTPVRAGVYFVRLRGPGIEAARRVLRLR